MLDISDVRVRLSDRGPGGLVAYASLIVNGSLVLHELKVIAAPSGDLILAMPNRPSMLRCSHCNHSVPINDSFCGRCGQPQPPGRVFRDKNGVPKARFDVVHPANAATRAEMEAAVFAVYYAERAKQTSALTTALEGEAA